MNKIFCMVVTFLCWLPSIGMCWDFTDLKEEAISPYTTDARYALYGGTALTVTILLFEDAVSDPFQVKQVRNKTLGETSRYGDWLGQLIPNILYSSGMTIAGYYQDPHGYDRAIGMFKATTYAASVTTILKYTMREPRPYNHDIRTSFPSGHTTTAFAFSGYIAGEHGWGWGAPALLLTTFIGYSRINDNMHWLHDVTAGATIGWVYGWGIAKHAKKKKKEDLEKEKIEGITSMVPMIDSKTIGLALYKEF